MTVEVTAAGAALAMNLCEITYRYDEQAANYLLVHQLQRTPDECRGDLLISATLALATMCAGWMHAATSAGVDVDERLAFARVVLNASLPTAGDDQG